MKPIVVVGSLNMDLVVKVARHPEPGETVLGGDSATFPGGKGANQAVAAARAGGSVQMVGLVGRDEFGNQLRANLVSNAVDDRNVGLVDAPTGMAMITVDGAGQNVIVVSPGANGRLTPGVVPPGLIGEAGLVMLQLEIPIETVGHVIQLCATMNVPVMLNPAPARPLSDGVLKGVRYLVLNETEAALLSGVEDPRIGADRLRQRGASFVVITLGEKGLVWCDRKGEGHLPAHEVQVVDTTAAGDAFCGALAAQLVNGVSFVEALRFANAAGALAVTRAGAQPSLPTAAQIAEFLAKS